MKNNIVRKAYSPNEMILAIELCEEHELYFAPLKAVMDIANDIHEHGIKEVRNTMMLASQIADFMLEVEGVDIEGTEV